MFKDRPYETKITIGCIAATIIAVIAIIALVAVNSNNRPVSPDEQIDKVVSIEPEQPSYALTTPSEAQSAVGATELTMDLVPYSLAEDAPFVSNDNGTLAFMWSDDLDPNHVGIITTTQNDLILNKDDSLINPTITKDVEHDVWIITSPSRYFDKISREIYAVAATSTPTPDSTGNVTGEGEATGSTSVKAWVIDENGNLVA